MTMMQKNFADQFEKAIEHLTMVPGSLIQATVLEIGKDFITLDAQLKSESLVPTEEFLDQDGQLGIQVGDEVQVVLESVENGYGETLLSREKAKRFELWKALESAYESGALVTGVINGRVKGGFTVELGEIRAFLPGSLVDVRPIKDTSQLEGKTLEFKVLKLDQRRNNVVVSRRAVLAVDQTEEREKLLAQLKEGMIIKGVVKNLTDYGAFVDLGGVDGLLHITDMAWKRVRHPSEIANVGDELQVQVLKFDAEKVRVSLGLKQLQPDPWAIIHQSYQKGMKVHGKISNFTDYGCFVALDSGVEGLVHISEMGWVNKNQHPSKLCQLGEEVEVMILDIDHERRRISLGMKQCKENPWKKFSERFERGTRVTGEIHSMTDFGIFVRLEGGIDGLIHLSDLSWSERSEEMMKSYVKGELIEAMVLQVDVARERISLGIKQFQPSPAESFMEHYKSGQWLQGTIKEVDQARRFVHITLAPETTGELSLEEAEAFKVSLEAGLPISVRVKELVYQGTKGTPVLLLTLQEMQNVAAKTESLPTPPKAAAPKPLPRSESKPENAMMEAFRLAKWSSESNSETQ